MWHPHARSEEGLVLLVDDREGGGDSHYLQRIAATFTSEKLRFETTRLPSKLHDYSFVYRRPNIEDEDVVIPLLIERKAEADLAASMKDGRWKRQHDSMVRTATRLYGPPGCRCVYILEGNVYQPVRCPCSCNGVGGCVKKGWPSEDSVRRNVIQRSSCFVGDFDIEFHTTKDVLGTCRLLLHFQKMINQMYVTGVQLKGIERSDISRNWNSIFRPETICPVKVDECEDYIEIEISGQSNKRYPAGERKTNDEDSYDSFKIVSSCALPVDQDPSVTKCCSNTTLLYDGDYFPNELTCNWAILVWLSANENDTTTRFNQEEIMQGCDRWNLSTMGMYEKKTQQGMYNGWSNVEQQLITKHQLVTRHYRKSGIETKYSLTNKGRQLANLLHACAHHGNTCGCDRKNVIPCTNIWSRVVIKKWPLKILKQTCRQRGLAVSGTKSVLVARLSSSATTSNIRTPTKKKSSASSITPGTQQSTLTRFGFKVVKRSGSENSSKRALFGTDRQEDSEGSKDSEDSDSEDEVGEDSEWEATSQYGDGNGNGSDTSDEGDW